MRTPLLLIIIIIVLAFLLASQVRQAKAEDDCAFGTWNVTRLPVIGLVCIGEPYGN